MWFLFPSLAGECSGNQLLAEITLHPRHHPPPAPDKGNIFLVCTNIFISFAQIYIIFGQSIISRDHLLACQPHNKICEPKYGQIVCKNIRKKKLHSSEFILSTKMLRSDLMSASCMKSSQNPHELSWSAPNLSSSLNLFRNRLHYSFTKTTCPKTKCYWLVVLKAILTKLELDPCVLWPTTMIFCYFDSSFEQLDRTFSRTNSDNIKKARHRGDTDK